MTEKNVDFNGKSSFDEIKINRQVLSVQKRVESEGNYEEQMGLINSINANIYLENTTIYDKQLKGNMLIIGDYVLMPQSNAGFHPTIKRLCLSTMKYDTIEYTEEEEYLHGYQFSSIADLQNGDIAYGRGEIIYILNKTTLQIKQKIHDATSFYFFFDVIKFVVFND